MADPPRTVLHVLPHPGGGGETYADALERMDGFRFERMCLAPAPRGPGVARSVLRRGLQVPSAARGHDLLHVHGEVAGAVCLPVLARRPSVVTLHGLHLLRRVSGARRAAAELNLRLLVRAATRTICVSDEERTEVLGIVGARRRPRVVAVRNGVEAPPPAGPAERAAARDGLGLSAEQVVGVWVGGLDEHKDPLCAVRAALEAGGEHPELALLVAGDGVLRGEVERLAAEGGGSVRVLGFRRDVGALLAAADFYVSSSRREGLSYSLLEAMALGLPAVVSDEPGNVEAAGDCALVVPRGDVHGFAVAYRRLLADAAERRELGARARERVERHFPAGAMVERTRAVYEEALGARPTP